MNALIILGNVSTKSLFRVPTYHLKFSLPFLQVILHTETKPLHFLILISNAHHLLFLVLLSLPHITHSVLWSMSAEVERTKVFDYHNQGLFCTASIRLTPPQLSILVT